MTNTRKWAVAIFTISVAALLVSAILGLFPIQGNSVEDRTVENQLGESRGITMSEGPKFTQAHSSDSITDVSWLLTEFEISGDSKFLAKAQLLFPDSIDVVILSALYAKSPDDKWLEKLEQLQPNNALPNLIRASLYAELSDKVRFAEEMEIGMSKSEFDTRYKPRLARIVDELLDSGRFPDSVFADGSLGNLDKPFIVRQGHILKMLVDNEDLFGGVDKTTLVSLEWAKRLQSMPVLNLTYLYFGGYLESRILERYQTDDLYGDEGKTVGDRREELIALANTVDRKLSKYDELILANKSTGSSDQILRRQFFSRVSADGEMAAVNWLMAQ